VYGLDWVTDIDFQPDWSKTHITAQAGSGELIFQDRYGNSFMNLHYKAPWRLKPYNTYCVYVHGPVLGTRTRIQIPYHPGKDQRITAVYFDGLDRSYLMDPESARSAPKSSAVKEDKDKRTKLAPKQLTVP
jgi:hypothetical protein